MLKTTTILGLTATLLLTTTAWTQAPEPLPTKAPAGVERPREARQGRGELGAELRERVRERLQRADGQGRRGRMQGRRGDEAKRLGQRGIERSSGQRNGGRGFRQSRSERSEFGQQRSFRAGPSEMRQRGPRPERGFDQRASLRQELAELKELRRELKQRIAELKQRSGKQGRSQRTLRR